MYGTTTLSIVTLDVTFKKTLKFDSITALGTCNAECRKCGRHATCVFYVNYTECCITLVLAEVFSNCLTEVQLFVQSKWLIALSHS
jgi:hypothetical protein